MEYRDRLLVVCIVALSFSVVEKFYFVLANGYHAYIPHDKWMSNMELLLNIDLWCTYAIILSVIGITILGVLYDPVCKLIGKIKKRF